ncbi:L-fuconolactonase [Saccharomonospora amisosensis]|uniref:L-fuconolactonase n=1 Tax=Saccharomonospora amisosensis TaxID=1128677 RepID=A0A7X5USH3_9PSEU|nr:amidohydrolase family protein [Saccharomonospora amisosensis]NIJ13370.1 L-fuconolactonase [Saccharomonospora amisosensis]
MTGDVGTIVDTHLHLWDLEVSDYAWLPRGSPLHASFTAARAKAELDGAGIGSAILVQAEDSSRDTEFMLRQAEIQPWIIGVVGWIKLDEPDTARRQLDNLLPHPAFRGVRHLVHDDPRADFLAIPEVRRSLTLLADHQVPFDVPDAWPRHLTATTELATALPALRVVLDHLGKPPRGDRDGFTAWRRAIAELARRPNTVAKVSGLQLAGQPLTASALRPAWETALEHFGPQRLMYGGDWPMTVPHGGYQPMWQVLCELIGELGHAERARLLHGTAHAVYGGREVPR